MEQDEIKRRIADVRARLKHLSAEKKELEREFRELLLSRERMIPASSPPHRMSDSFPPEKKIGIFRSLFRGRKDVFPRRFESRKTGKSGYQPVCVNEWRRGICAKPKIKSSECPYREWLPVSAQIIEKHLRGTDERGKDFTIGVYPMREDETCFFLAVDFAKQNFREAVRNLDLSLATASSPIRTPCHRADWAI